MLLLPMCSLMCVPIPLPCPRGLLATLGLPFPRLTLRLLLMRLPPPRVQSDCPAPAPPPCVLPACPSATGPTPAQLDWDPKHGLILECKNLSSLASYWQVFADRKAQVSLLADWPDLCTQGRLAFLSKGGDAASPLDFRKLSILCKVYRLHMALRLKDLAPWISSWALP